MADVVDKQTRSRMMAGIRAKDTSPELLVRRGLHQRGFRFALHRRDLPGRPDLVLPKYRAVVFVHGCYWHRHSGCAYTSTPSTRRDFWTEKFEKNVSRDRRNIENLLERGWRVFVVWECGLRHSTERMVTELSRLLKSGVEKAELPESPVKPCS